VRATGSARPQAAEGAWLHRMPSGGAGSTPAATSHERSEPAGHPCRTELHAPTGGRGESHLARHLPELAWFDPRRAH
jgi:hypothetical protein